MPDDMGTFRGDIEIENPARLGRWSFRQADGTVLERWTGVVVIGVAGRRNRS